MAIERLIADFADHPGLPEALYKVASQYEGRRRYEKAFELYQYIEDNLSEEYVILSRGRLIMLDIGLGNDADAQAALDRLIADFSDNPVMARVIWDTAQVYCKLEKYEKASELYQYVIDNWPKSEHEMRARTGNVRIDILAGDQAAVDSAIDGLIADFNEHPGLPTAVFVIGEEYYNRAFQMKNEGLETESEDCFQKAIAIWDIIIEGLPVSLPDTAHAWYFSAVSYRRMGEYGNAILYYQEVVDNWPGYEYAWSAQCLIGECFEKLQKSGALPEGEAEPLIEQAYTLVIEDYPECSLAGHACLKLAEMNLKKGREFEAAGYYELFLTAAPADPRVKSVKARLERLGAQSK